MDHGVKHSRFRDEGLLLQACITGDGSESGRAITHLSAATIKSFRESRSFRHYSLSSATSSPGYIPKGHIDPSTYSFTEALKALQQARCGSARESMASMRYLEGRFLNSKWDEAERYICNPLSGEVPIQCLSSSLATKTWAEQRSRTVPVLTRTFKSAPLSFPSHGPQESKPLSIPAIEEVTASEELKGRNGSRMRDVGTQITPLDCSSSSPSITSAAVEENRAESFRLTGRRCFIFHVTPKSKAAAEGLQGKLENCKISGERKERKEGEERKETKKVSPLLGWKAWWASKHRPWKWGERKARERPHNAKAGKDSAIITIQATLELQQQQQ
ncbi:uncharacterized protein LOC116246808 isoform X1 [Nymphaea colorata]|nr:uncharacterized protein LOC116246808 isoform X1 [Nymphaea colorata]